MFDWFWDVIAYLGFANKSGRILFLGLDNAGKTTLTHMLRDGKVIEHEPTRHPQGEEVMIGSIKFKTFDMGGHRAARRLWRDYFAQTDAVVFMVDSADPDRLYESAEELNMLLQTEELATCPFLILGNKVDLPTALSEDDVVQALGVGYQRTGKDKSTRNGDQRPLEVFMCSVVKKAGYADGFKWVAGFL